MKEILELMLKYKQVPVNIIGFIVVFCFLGFLIFQTTNHIPTQMEDIKEDVRRVEDKMEENHKEVNSRIDRLEDKMDENHKEVNSRIDRLEDKMNRLEDKIDKNHREMIELFRSLIERDTAKDKK